MKQGTSTGVLDEFLTPICVGDEIVDKAGTHYTIDRFGRAKPTSGGNEVPIKNLEGVTVCKSWAGHAESITKAVEQPAPAPECKKELAIENFGDQDLADELRRRGYEVKATKTTIVEI